MKRFLFLLLAVSLVLSSCGSFVSDTVPNKPQRVAVMTASLAEIWLEAGGHVDITVGETVERGLVPKDTALADSGAGKTVNAELVLSLKPDLVIFSADIPAQVRAEAIVRQTGTPTLLLRVETLDDYINALAIMTEITQNKAAYENALGMKTRIDTLIEENRATLSGKSILFVRAGSSASSTRAKGSDDHFAAAILRDLGCVNIADSAPLSLDHVGMEAILAADPDHVLFSLMGDEVAARANVESLLKTDVWQSLSAVSQGNYTILDRDLFHFKPCSRWEQAYLTLVKILK